MDFEDAAKAMARDFMVVRSTRDWPFWLLCPSSLLTVVERVISVEERIVACPPFKSEYKRSKLPETVVFAETAASIGALVASEMRIEGFGALRFSWAFAEEQALTYSGQITAKIIHSLATARLRDVRSFLTWRKDKDPIALRHWSFQECGPAAIEPDEMLLYGWGQERSAQFPDPDWLCAVENSNQSGVG